MEDAHSTKDFQALRDRMILCDNVSRSMIREFDKKKPILIGLDWLDYIVNAVKPRIGERLGIRRSDYDILLRKYFEDIYKILLNLFEIMNPDGKIAWVVGDSLVLDVYIPTDLLTMLIEDKIGFQLELVEIDRIRCSGIRRSFILRESIIYFKKKRK